MRRRQAPIQLLPRLKRAAIGLLLGLIFTIFAWSTHAVSTVNMPDAGIPTEIYASENRDDLRKLFLSAIGSAEKSIHLLVYTLTDEAIIYALKEKARLGADVRVIVDAKASPYAAQSLGPEIKTLRRLGPGLMHDKILVIDDRLAWLGSANMTADSLQVHSNLVLGMYSPALAEHLIAKATGMPECGKSPELPLKEFKIGKQDVELYFLPDESKNAMARIKALIRSAEKTLHIAMFTWTRQDLAHEVIRAASRGVAVQVVIDNNTGKGASAHVVKLLNKSGIDVRLSRGIGLLHHKFMVIDGKVLVNGSANWTKAAFGVNDDFFVVIDDLTAEQSEKLEQEWSVLYGDTQKVQ